MNQSNNTVKYFSKKNYIEEEMNVMAKDLDFNVNLEDDIDAEIKAFIGSTKSKKQKMSLIQMVIVLAQVDPKFLTIQPVKHLYLYFCSILLI